MIEMADIVYNGPQLLTTFLGYSKQYNATSGLKYGGENFQNAKFQNLKDKGPIPEGLYSFKLKIDKSKNAAANFATCTILPADSIQRIPRGSDAAIPLKIQQDFKKQVGDSVSCEDFWANWGQKLYFFGK